MSTGADVPRPALAPVSAPRSAGRSASHLLLASVFVGGAIGALARASLEELVPTTSGGWPWATFAANLIGTALLAFFVTRLQERLPPSTYRRPFVGSGLCGGLTTFSALQLELLQLARDGHTALAVAYLATSLVLGLVVMFLVTKLVRRTRIR
jgi:fluoride exporter